MEKYLPGIGIKGLVLSIKQSLRLRLKSFLGFVFSHNTHPLIHIPIIPPQKGFAPIALVVLLLFGIAAGVLLVQNGINFLPKAAPDPNFLCSPNGITDSPNAGSGCPADQKKVFAYCTNTNDPDQTPIKNKTVCDAAIKADLTQINYYCNWDPPQCPVQGPAAAPPAAVKARAACLANGSNYVYDEPNDKCLKPCRFFDGKEYASGTSKDIVCSSDKPGKMLVQTCTDGQTRETYPDRVSCTTSQPAAASTVKSCTYPDIIDRGAIFSHCDTNSEKHIEDKGKCNRLATQGNGFALFCKKDGETPAAQPASQQTSAGQPTAGGCNETEAKSCKGKCYKDTSGKKQCTESNENLSGCSEDQQKQCTDKNRSNGCMIIRGEIKCLYSEGAKCDSEDSGSCSQGCAVVQREGSWVSECKATVCSQGYHNFCMATKNKSCEIEKSTGVPDCTGDPSKAPKQPTTGAPATGTAPRTTGTGTGAQTTATAPRPGPEGRTGQPAAPGTAPAQPAAPLICGKDKDELDIPCYAIGVFSKEELTSREAQAKIASVNYERFRNILTTEQERIGADIKANAEKKIAEAEAAMKACLK